MAKIKVNPETREDLLEAAEDIVDAMFDALEDGKITPEEAKTLAIGLAATLISIPVPDPLEPTVDPLVVTFLAGAWDKVEDAFRNEERLTKRIAAAVAANKPEKAARLQDILDELLAETPDE